MKVSLAAFNAHMSTDYSPTRRYLVAHNRHRDFWYVWDRVRKSRRGRFPTVRAAFAYADRKNGIRSNH